jgi:hypothetical protein
MIFYHMRLLRTFLSLAQVLRHSSTPCMSAKEYTFVCYDGKLKPENFSACKFLRKVDIDVLILVNKSMTVGMLNCTIHAGEKCLCTDCEGEECQR